MNICIRSPGFQKRGESSTASAAEQEAIGCATMKDEVEVEVELELEVRSGIESVLPALARTWPTLMWVSYGSGREKIVRCYLTFSFLIQCGSVCHCFYFSCLFFLLPFFSFLSMHGGGRQGKLPPDSGSVLPVYFACGIQPLRP